MNKPPKNVPRPLAAFTAGVLADSFARQGFASSELVTRWPEIAGQDIAAHAEPVKLQWPRVAPDEPPEPATLVLRVEGPAALEIQHMAAVIIERVNRFFGWQAVGRLALRQAPLSRRSKPKVKTIDPAETARLAAALPAIADDDLRQAVARLGSALKRRT